MTISLEELGRQRAAELAYNGQVACAVYGWQPQTDADGDVFYKLPDGSVRNPFHIPPYGTEDAAALEIAEALRQRGWRIDLNLMPGDPVYYCVLYRDRQTGAAQRDRLCRAICNATLSALE